MSKWYEESSNLGAGVVISSRIRLARNLSAYAFPGRAETNVAKKVIMEIYGATEDSTSSLKEELEHVNMTHISQIDKIAMMELHIISPQFAKSETPSALIVSKDESLSVMINEEDHIRIQSMTIGMNLEEALRVANAMDDLLEEQLDYAFDEQMGYLTSCPTNLGTGMRASYMVHLPALESTGQLQFILEAIGKFGLTVRGIYGEGTEAQGSMFQISNQVTLGQTETEIIENLTSVTKQIMEQEVMVRRKLLHDKRHHFEDAVYRALGLLSYARMMTAKEAMSLLSDLKLGIDLGILKTENGETINIYSMMSKIQPANLQLQYNRQLSVEERDMARAEYIRGNMPRVIT